MPAEKIETSEAVYRDIYGKTKKKRRTKDQRRNAIRQLSQGSRRECLTAEHRKCEAAGGKAPSYGRRLRLVKQRRAQGGCLGTESRRKT